MIGVIFGPPGSGKGTQAAKIENAFRLKHLSTGDILRSEVARGTPIGKEAGRIMAAGDLVPDELIVDIVRGRLPEAEAGEGVLLDGFPRTVGQAQALDNMLSEEGHKVDFVIALDVPEAELVEFEWVEEGKPYREFLVPAALLNRCRPFTVSQE